MIDKLGFRVGLGGWSRPSMTTVRMLHCCFSRGVVVWIRGRSHTGRSQNHAVIDGFLENAPSGVIDDTF